MVRLLALLGLLAAAVATVPPSPGAWANPPFGVAAAKIDLTVGHDLTLVSGRYTLQYREDDDPDHADRIFIHYPIYVAADVPTWQDAVAAADLKLQVGAQTYSPVAGGRAETTALTDYPIVDDAQVYFVTFEIPRSAARVRFDATITYVQPNFHYRNGLVALFTPWLPKLAPRRQPLVATDQSLLVTVHAGDGLALKVLTSHPITFTQSASEIAVRPEHRQTVAVEISTVSAKTGAP